MIEAACIASHEGEEAEAAFDLEDALGLEQPEEALFQWRRARAMLEVGGMPPKRKLQGAKLAAAFQFLDHAEERALEAGGGPGFEAVRRLTREELGHCLDDLLGVRLDMTRLLPAETVQHGGFANQGETLYLHSVWLERAGSAVRLAIQESLSAAGEAQPAWIEKAEAELEDLTRMAARAYRRPLMDHELHALSQGWRASLEAGRSPRAALRQGLETVLTGAPFLLRLEDRPKGSSEVQPVTAIGLASRLSFFLWRSCPDPELSALAERGDLQGLEGLTSAANRLLDDPRSLRFAEAFASQWLGYGGLGTRIKPDPIDNPQMTDRLMAEMRAEAGRFVHDLVVEDRPLRAFLWGARSWVGPELAEFYGMDLGPEAFAQDGAGRWAEHASADRQGILGRAAVLATTAFPERTSPVLRGAFVLERILGMPPPPPPPGVSEFDEAIEERERLTERGKLELHRKRADCAACHARIDPLGFALDGFDRFGRERAADTSGVLPDGTTFDNLSQLKDLLLERHGLDMAKEASRRILAFALGRQLTWEDERTVLELALVLQKEGWRAWVLAVVSSRPFRFQDPAAAPQGSESR